jgi:hypothetical protein
MKLDRSVFLYMSPKKDVENFAQCSTCVNFLPKKQKCAYFGNKKIKSTGSCGLYVYGVPDDTQDIFSSITPEDAGYVDRKVRCENCFFANNGICRLFRSLNQKYPNTFNLDINIEKKGCCNANTARSNVPKLE